MFAAVATQFIQDDSPDMYVTHRLLTLAHDNCVGMPRTQKPSRNLKHQRIPFRLPPALPTFHNILPTTHRKVQKRMIFLIDTFVSSDILH